MRVLYRATKAPIAEGKARVLEVKIHSDDRIHGSDGSMQGLLVKLVGLEFWGEW